MSTVRASVDGVTVQIEERCHRGIFALIGWAAICLSSVEKAFAPVKLRSDASHFPEFWSRTRVPSRGSSPISCRRRTGARMAPRRNNYDPIDHGNPPLWRKSGGSREVRLIRPGLPRMIASFDDDRRSLVLINGGTRRFKDGMDAAVLPAAAVYASVGRKLILGTVWVEFRRSRTVTPEQLPEESNIDFVTAALNFFGAPKVKALVTRAEVCRRRGGRT